MRRLYLQIYLTVMAVIVLFALLTAAIWFHFDPASRHYNLLQGVARVAAEMVPGSEVPEASAKAELEQLAEWFRVEVALFSAEGERIAEAGGHPPSPAGRSESGFVRNPGRGPTAAILLDDGRWLVVAHQHSPSGVILAAFVLAIATAIGTFPLVRRLTRRLERLEAGVTELGRGELDRRVEVEGSDEIARLAASFNRAAERIEGLIDAQRQTLAGASHELRTPLSRMRVAVELLESGNPEKLKRRLTADIEELDELIDELLMASRIESMGHSEPFEEVDLLALIAEEAARTGAELSGVQTTVLGDPRMLRRMVRNLLQNSARYGEGAVEVEVSEEAEETIVRIADHGPGIPADERERIFEPFYRLADHDGDRRSQRGVGLGLALVRRIARHHQSSVVCHERETGRGAVFEVRLPRRLRPQ